jgi:RNase P subunit RPR2
MIRIAQERVYDLFELAETEATRGRGPLADRYVRLARSIGTRYNVRLPQELGERFCRGCSSFWVEGRNVRTRLRGGRRTRTCLVCGRVRRSSVAPPSMPPRHPPPEGRVEGELDVPEPVVTDEPEEDETDDYPPAGRRAG